MVCFDALKGRLRNEWHIGVHRNLRAIPDINQPFNYRSMAASEWLYCVRKQSHQFLNAKQCMKTRNEPLSAMTDRKGIIMKELQIVAMLLPLSSCDKALPVGFI